MALEALGRFFVEKIRIFLVNYGLVWSRVKFGRDHDQGWSELISANFGGWKLTGLALVRFLSAI